MILQYHVTATHDQSSSASQNRTFSYFSPVLSLMYLHIRAINTYMYTYTTNVIKLLVICFWDKLCSVNMESLLCCSSWGFLHYFPVLILLDLILQCWSICSYAVLKHLELPTCMRSARWIKLNWKPIFLLKCNKYTFGWLHITAEIMSLHDMYNRFSPPVRHTELLAEMRQAVSQLGMWWH